MQSVQILKNKSTQKFGCRVQQPEVMLKSRKININIHNKRKFSAQICPITKLLCIRLRKTELIRLRSKVLITEGSLI